MTRTSNTYLTNLGLTNLGLAGLLVGMLIGCGSSDAPKATDPSKTTPAVADPAAKTEPKETPAVLSVVGGAEYNFGTTEVGQEFEHVFEIQNVTDAEVKLKAGTPSCVTCTSFTVDKEALKPKETLKARVKWHVKNENPEFRQFAPIMYGTGEELRLYVVGKVVKRIVLSPVESWNIGDVVEGKPTEYQATISSSILDKFDIDSIANTNPALKVTHTPLRPEQLSELKVKTGYNLNVTLDPSIAIGEFKDRVTINVLDPKPIALKVDAVAKRTGPIKIFGANWHEETATLRLANFDPKQEFVTRLNLFTRGVEGDLKIDSVKCADDRFTVELKPDPKFAGTTSSKRYELLVKIAASDRSVVYTPQAPLVIEVVTNQPQIGTIKFNIRGAQLR